MYVHVKTDSYLRELRLRCFKLDLWSVVGFGKSRTKTIQSSVFNCEMKTVQSHYVIWIVPDFQTIKLVYVQWNLMIMLLVFVIVWLLGLKSTYHQIRMNNQTLHDWQNSPHGRLKWSNNLVSPLGIKSWH